MMSYSELLHSFLNYNTDSQQYTSKNKIQMLSAKIVFGKSVSGPQNRTRQQHIW